MIHECRYSPFNRVLKRREARLLREQDGLKSLLSGLVGGPALLKEWEREWREKFGGAEKDELDDDLASANASDEEDGDGDEPASREAIVRLIVSSRTLPSNKKDALMHPICCGLQPFDYLCVIHREEDCRNQGKNKYDVVPCNGET